MLNEREWRVLAMIEQGLRAEERRFAKAFDTGTAGRKRRSSRWPIRALVGFGILLVVLGLLASAGGLFLQGLLFGGTGVAWSRRRKSRATVEKAG
jgi:Protein of unknown function (DUF3040)